MACNVDYMRGDTLCTDDAGYQATRAKVHNPWVQRLFLTLPLFIRRRIAARMRAGSKITTANRWILWTSMRRPSSPEMEKHQRTVADSRSHAIAAIFELSVNDSPFRAWC